jgi:hypothetical protein
VAAVVVAGVNLVLLLIDLLLQLEAAAGAAVLVFRLAVQVEPVRLPEVQAQVVQM